MSNALGELFSNIAIAIREKTGDTATMKPAEFPAKISGITTGGSNEVVLFAKQDVGGFSLNSQFGAFAKDYVGTAPFVLEVGKKYRVLWDGEDVSCTAYSNSALGYPMVCIGDGTQIGGQSKNEPFLIVYTPSANYLTLFAKDDKTTHNVAVYHVTEASGGSSADVRYVTFMSYDGSVEYGKKAVAVGDDCADPIARGVFSTPTRESTAQYNYDFAGWATTANGAMDANWNKAVTEDRTVYANFAAIVRYYTISFYDGDTLLTTKSVAYGSVPSYAPTKDGYDFDGWTPTPVAVTGEATYTAKWKTKATFETATWSQIAEICDSGNAATTFAIGDRKPVTLTYTDGTAETIWFTIVDMGVDLKEDGTYAPLTLMADNLVKKSFKGASAYNKGKTSFYENDNVIAKMDELYSAMPSELQSAIKSVFKYDDYNDVYQRVFVPSYKNLTGVDMNSSNGNGYTLQTNHRPNARYKYFANGGSFKRCKLDSESEDDYWTSTLNKYQSASYTSAHYYVMDGDGVYTTYENIGNATHGVCPCFCI